MKKIIVLLIIIFLSNGCDDGDLKVDAISFDDVAVQKCPDNDVIYKIKSNEALLLEIPESSNPFENEPTTSPREFAIGGNNKVVYRSYNGVISVNNICTTIQASNPNVVEEWIATSGTIQIKTTAVFSPNTTINSPNATKIVAYDHAIVLKNVTFLKPTGAQLYETFVFGSYRDSNVTSLPFAFDLVENCTALNQVYTRSGSESLQLNVNPSLFQNASGTQITVVNSTNKVTYKLFESNINNYNFCANPLASTPLVREVWTANNGVSNVSGIIEVTTTTFGTGFQHTIRLKKMTLSKGNSSFYLGDNYLFGSFIQ